MIRPKMRRNNKLSEIPNNNITRYVLLLSCLIMNISYSMYESIFIYELRGLSLSFLVYLFYRITLIYNFMMNILLFLSLLENEKLHHNYFFKILQSLDLVFLIILGLNYNIKSMMILFFININTNYISSKY
jgi:hypothetical protein